MTAAARPAGTQRPGRCAMTAPTAGGGWLDRWAVSVGAGMLRAIMLARWSAHALVAVSMLGASVAHAEAVVATLAQVKGEVSVRAPGAGAYAKASAGATLASGARVKTGAGAEARLEYPGGAVLEIKPGSELIVRVPGGNKPAGATLFLGRVWSKVAKGAGGDTKFEVESANAVAGVRGTEFEVGVGLDGSTRVRVTEGEVAVGGEDDGARTGVKAGKELESEDGKLGKVRPSPADADWDGWFSRSAARMEKAGLKVAQSLDGRLGRRKAQVDKLVAEQKKLRQAIQRLEAAGKKGDDVRGELERTHAQLERVTARLESMKGRLEGAFGLFATWSARAQGLPDGAQIGAMARDVEKVAQDFADMIEEGTDQSQEGMDELMDDMRRGKSDRPKDSAADELFR